MKAITCPRCEGHKMIQDGTRDYFPCPICDGTGRAWVPENDSELEEIRKKDPDYIDLREYVD